MLMAHKDLLKIALVLTITASAGSAFGAKVITSSTVLGNSSFSPSTMVKLDVASGSSNYSLYAQHTNGNRVFWGGSADSRVYYSTKNPGDITDESGVSATDNKPANWSSL
jgi:hypothetical protein